MVPDETRSISLKMNTKKKVELLKEAKNQKVEQLKEAKVKRQVEDKVWKR